MKIQPKKITRKKEGKKEAFCKEESHQDVIYNGPLLTIATGKGWIKQTPEFLLFGTVAALKRIISMKEAAESGRGG